MSDNYKMAIESIRSSRVRSFLTMLGVIIGVVSVITTVSLGEGVKNQVSGQIGKLGANTISIQPGKLVDRDDQGNIVGVNILSTLGSGSLSDEDLADIQNTEGVVDTVPLSLVTGVPKYEDRPFSTANVIGTTPGFDEIVNEDVEFGSFFSEDSMVYSRHAVIGRNVANTVFGENIPIGKSISIRGHEFIVQGIFPRVDTNPINPTFNINSSIFIPFERSKEIAEDQTHLFQVLAKINTPDDSDKAVTAISNALKENRSGEEDFTVLRQEETLAIAQDVVRLITSLVAGIAAISLLIGGIGIMNIMLVSVSERTREIGIRKAVGATNSQIRSQFVIEAVVLSVWGAMIGLFVSGMLNFVIRIFTDLKPVITIEVVLIATIVSVLVGIIFGLAPAIKAARKDPIEALRNY